MASQYKQYKDAVEVLGKLITKEQAASINKMEEISLEYALAKMAYNVTNNPKLLKELFEFYKEVPSNMHVSLPPPLEDKHCIEKYRSSWEYLFLAPLGDKRVNFMNNDNFFLDALYWTNNIHSVPVLYYNFRLN